MYPALLLLHDYRGCINTCPGDGHNLGSTNTSDECHVHVLDTFPTPTLLGHVADTVWDMCLQCPIFFLGLRHATDTSLNSWTHSRHFSGHTIDTYLIFFFIKNQPKKWDYIFFLKKLAYFGNLFLFHVTFCLLLFYARLWFAPFAQHHLFTFSSTSLSLVIFHSSLPCWCLVVLLGWLHIRGPFVYHFVLFFFSSSLTFLSFHVFLVHPLFVLI